MRNVFTAPAAAAPAAQADRAGPAREERAFDVGVNDTIPFSQILVLGLQNVFGMTGMFVDGVSAGDHVFVSLGELEPQPKDEKLHRILSFSRF